MKYQCSKNPTHLFVHPEKLSENKWSAPVKEDKEKIAVGAMITETTYSRLLLGTIDISVCPFCESKEYSEFVEPAEDVESVHIYDLTTGPQTELNSLLAQGYKIVNRYSKQYHLEKPKTKNPNYCTKPDLCTIENRACDKCIFFKHPQSDPDDNQIYQEQAETAYKKLEEAKP